MEKRSILVIDDEEEIRELIHMYMMKEGFHYIEAINGKEALSKIKEHHPDLILLDISLPDSSGFDICPLIREITDAPVLFISCRDTELDKVLGLTVGGDDYISKPFSPNELVARIKAHLRRVQQMQRFKSIEQTGEVLSSKSITINTKQLACSVYGEAVNLSATEFKLLEFFMRHPFQVFNHEHLIDRIWGFHTNIDCKTVSVHIGNIRKKIGDNPKSPEIILTLRGAGYKFNEEVFKHYL
ncbi:MAG TPA: response regulator transcription factor [Bacillales bacterium]|nr:response regulator transcription factor [Bacillales bacterium]